MTDNTKTGMPLDRSIAEPTLADVRWFADTVQAVMGENLNNLTVYGPVVTSIFDPKKHQVHTLIVVERRDIDQLLRLSESSGEAAKRHISPPLMMTVDGLDRSRDTFPLEWLDIYQFHQTVFGKPMLSMLNLDDEFVRLQCERELRSLDIRLQRGVLAGGGNHRSMDHLNKEASDSLIRVLRGIAWLAGERKPLLPDAVCRHCESVVEHPLDGCGQVIHVHGGHDLNMVRLMIDEVAKLLDWIDQFDSPASPRS